MTRKITAPVVNAETKAFWNAAREGRFMVPVCTACGKAHWYPRAICPFCASDQIEWRGASGKGEIDLGNLAALDQVDMFGQAEHGLDEVQVADFRRLGGEQRACQEIRLFLVVALDAHPVARFDHGFKQRGDLA